MIYGWDVHSENANPRRKKPRVEVALLNAAGGCSASGGFFFFTCGAAFSCEEADSFRVWLVSWFVITSEHRPCR